MFKLPLEYFNTFTASWTIYGTRSKIHQNVPIRDAANLLMDQQNKSARNVIYIKFSINTYIFSEKKTVIKFCKQEFYHSVGKTQMVFPQMM